MVFKKNDIKSKLASERGNKASICTWKNKKELNIQNYELHPNLCKCCNNSLPYKKRNNLYCGHSCAAKINNINIVRNGIAKKKCISCGKQICKKDVERCDKCRIDFNIINDIYVSSHVLRKYLINLRGYKCERCELIIWQDQLIPLDVHHIDGDPKNSKQKNLLLLCKNCHALTNNYCNKKRKV